MSFKSLFSSSPELLSTSIEFDYAATTPALLSVQKVMQEAVSRYGSINRSTGKNSDLSTFTYAGTKKTILNFLGVGSHPDYTVVYTKNTTEGINLLAHTLIKDKQTKVLLTRMEHHSNDLPWRYLASPQYVEVDALGRLDLQSLQQQLEAGKGCIAFVSVTAASNVTGYINPIHKIAKLAHANGAKIIVDAAQLIAHHPIDMLGQAPDEAIDYLVFSGHKMYAPYGCGVVVGAFPERMTPHPFMLGGGTVIHVDDYQYTRADVPHGLEAGTQNLLGVIALEAALHTLIDIGFNQLSHYEHTLKTCLIEGLRSMPHVVLYGDSEDFSDRLGVIPFNIKGKSYGEVSAILYQSFNITTRCGKMCAHPYIHRLLHHSTQKDMFIPLYYGEEGLVRISLGLPNTLEDCTHLLEVIDTSFKK